MFKVYSHAGEVQAHDSNAPPCSIVAHQVIHRKTKTSIQHEREGTREIERQKEKERKGGTAYVLCVLEKNYTIIQLFEIAVHSSVQALWVELFADQILLITQKKDNRICF